MEGEVGEGAARRPGPGSKVEVVGAQTAPEGEEGELEPSSRVEVAAVCCPPTRAVGEGGHQTAVVGVVGGCCQ